MGKKLKVLNVVLPAVCAVTLVAAPMTVWGIESSWSANNFDATCIGDIKLSNRHVKLHHDFHTILTPKNDDEEIDAQILGKPVIIFVGDRELDEDEFSYDWDDDGGLIIDVLGEYITKQTLIIYGCTTKKATFELISETTQSTIILNNSITFTFDFQGTKPNPNVIQVSALFHEPPDPDHPNMILEATTQAMVDNEGHVNTDFNFANTFTPDTLEACTIPFTLHLDFLSGNTEQEQSFECPGLTAILQ